MSNSNRNSKEADVVRPKLDDERRASGGAVRAYAVCVFMKGPSWVYHDRSGAHHCSAAQVWFP